MTAPVAAISSDYTDWQQLGHGALGETWRAFHRPSSRDVVVKIREQTADAAAAADREAKLLASLRHPALQTFIGQESGADYVVLVYDYVDGPSVAELLQEQGRLPLPEAVRIALALLSGLRELHAAGVIHRDISPQNVILNAAGNPVLIDFNALGHLTEQSSIGATTRVGQFAGKLLYMTPEQIMGAPQSASADIWAVGALLYEMVVGQSFRQGVTPAMLLAEASDPGAPNVSAAPAQLRPVLSAMLAQDAGSRPDAARAGALLKYTMAGLDDSSDQFTMPGAPPALQPELLPPASRPAPLPPASAPRTSRWIGRMVLLGLPILLAAVLGMAATTYWLSLQIGDAMPPPPPVPEPAPSTPGFAEMWRDNQASVGLFALGIGLMSVGLMLARIFRRRAASLQDGLPFQAANLIAGPDARSQLTQTILVEIDAYHAAAGHAADQMLTVTMVALAKEYADAETSDARMKALSMLHDLHSKVAARLRPWWLDYETIVARGISFTGLGAGALALFEGVQRLF